MHKGRLHWESGLYAFCTFGSFPYAGITLIRSAKGRRKSGISVPKDTPNERSNYVIRILYCQGNISLELLLAEGRTPGHPVLLEKRVRFGLGHLPDPAPDLLREIEVTRSQDLLQL